MRFWVAALTLLPTAIAAFQADTTQQPPIQLDTKAELILVDATVVDDKGTPIGDLTNTDFVVSVDGRPRSIASLQFVKTSAPVETRPRLKAAHFSTNEGESDARRIMIVIDENSIPPGGARAVLMSVERLLKDLPPTDRVAFIRLPQFENSVDFTPDRQRVFEAVKKTTGKARRAGFGQVTLAEAVAYERADSAGWQRAIMRICASAMPSKMTAAPGRGASAGVAFSAEDEYGLCQQGAQNDAMDKISTYQRRALETLDGLRQVISNLRAVPGPKTLVVLSQGFLSYDRRPEINELAARAAAARVALYAIHIDQQTMELDSTEMSFTRMEDEQLLADGIDTLAGASRGARFRIVGSGDSVFARVARELSGYYLIGLEPAESDRDGQPHRIKVEVKRPGTTVRARGQFTIASAANAAAAPVTPAGQLLELLRAATPDSGVPLRLTAFTAPSSAANQVKVILGADVGAPAVSPLNVHVGYVLVDSDGKVAADEFITVALQQDGTDSPATPRYIGLAEVPPGDYTIRFAVIAPDGRTGSVHHPVSAKLKEAGGVAVSDLILATPVRGAQTRPDVHVRLDGPALQALLELTGSDRTRLKATQVQFEVSNTPDGDAILSERGQLRGSNGDVTPVAAILNVGVLPPGEYVARAVVSVPGEKPIATTRPFEIAPRRRPAKPAETTEANRSATPVPARGRMRPPIPPFKPQDVLAPAVVNPFIDHVLASYAPSPAAREALNAIKAGKLREAAKGQRQVEDVGLSFAQGLGMLAENRTAEADAYFRAALRSASDFIGAAFYLGATLAAAGKDRDAIGAWQTALIGEVGTAGVYPVLIDGLLRVGDAEEALAVLEEAEPTFTDRLQYERRLAQAYTLAARYREALPLAHRYLAQQPTDLDMLFLTLHMIYEGHATGELADSPAELEKFREYAERYAAAKGPQLLVVQGWRKALGIS